MLNESILELYSTRVIDNRRVSMSDALQELIPLSQQVDMAVGYFYISAFHTLIHSFNLFMEQPNASIRILMGNQTNTDTKETISLGLTPEEAVVNDIQNTAPLRFSQFSKWMREGRIQVRIYTGDANYFHAKSYLFQRDFYGVDGYAIVGSSNFSNNGLIGNTELNTMSCDNYVAIRKWYDELWESDEVKDFSPEIINVIDRINADKDVECYLSAKSTYYEFARQFVKAPLNLIDEEVLVGLYPHQKTGVSEVQSRLQLYGTALLCDGVGLGKTRTAAAVLKSLNNPITLIIISSKLRNQWLQELKEVNVSLMNVHFVSKEQIARMSATELRGLAVYELFVIDEAHQGLKSGNTKLYRNIEYIKKHATHKILGLLMTATPWNNSRRDIFHLGRLFLNSEKIPSNRPYVEYLKYAPSKAAKAFEIDNQAFNSFWEDLFLQRTRKTYGGEGVSFANRNFPVVEVKYEYTKEKAFAANYERISRLSLPYMDPLRYLDDKNDEFTSDRLKMLILKRADSSWAAFISTISNIKSKVVQLINDIKHVQEDSNRLKSRFINWISEAYGLDERINDLFPFNFIDINEDLTDFEIISRENKQRYARRLEERISTIDKRKANRLVNKILSDGEKDLDILKSIEDDFAQAFSIVDEKYEVVSRTLSQCLQKGKKVLVITQFRDTAIDYYKKFINDEKLRNYRLGIVTGNLEDSMTNNSSIVDKEEILKRFAPIAKNAIELITNHDQLDVIIGTDTLSVGQNLQDSSILMNLDLPYNPMNLEQRIGRIDRPRIDGQVSNIDIYTFPSMPVIEAELRMTERLRNKLKGIISDTRFDDLVLPEYEDFLKKILFERDQGSSAVEEMVEKSVDKQIVPVEAQSHSARYIKAQKRMWEYVTSYVEENKPGNSTVFPNISLSKAVLDLSSVAVLTTQLCDVNGEYIETITRPYSLMKFSDDLAEIEDFWFNGTLNNIHDSTELSVSDAFQAKSVLEEKLNFVTDSLVSFYNSKIDVVKEVENHLSDPKARQVTASIMSEVRGVNRDFISNRVTNSGYELKTVRSIAEAIEYIDERESLYADVLDLHVNIKLLWNNYDYYYQKFIGDKNLYLNDNLSSVADMRLACPKLSKTLINVAHIVV